MPAKADSEAQERCSSERLVQKGLIKSISVARNHSTSDLAFLTNVHSAKELAKRENNSAIFGRKL
jgi:hypothetical protein